MTKYLKSNANSPSKIMWAVTDSHIVKVSICSDMQANAGKLGLAITTEPYRKTEFEYMEMHNEQITEQEFGSHLMELLGILSTQYLPEFIKLNELNEEPF